MTNPVVDYAEPAHPSAAGPENVRRMLAILIAILLLGFGLRVYHSGARSLWWDEGASLKWAMMPPGEMIEQSRSQDTNPPAYHLILHYWVKLFGNSEVALRMLSAVAGTLGVFVIYRLGAVMFNRRAGVLAAALMAVNEMQLYYSREARSYALSTLLALVTMLCAWRIIRHGPTAARILIYVLCAALMPYVHNYGVFVVAAVNIFYLVAWLMHRDRVRISLGKWVAINFGVALLLLPYVMFIKGAVSQVNQAFWTTKPTLKDLVVTFMTFSGGAIPSAIYGVLCVISVVLLMRRYSSVQPGADPANPRDEGPMELLFLLIWLACPVLMPFLASWIFMPIYSHRYAMGATPALILLAAYGLDVLFRQRYVGAAATALIIAIAGYRAGTLIRTGPIEPWREASRDVASRANPRDLVLVYGHVPVFGKDLFDYYAGRTDLEIHGLPTPYSPVSLEQVQSMAKIAEGRDRVWLLIAHEKDPDKLMKKQLTSKFPTATPIDTYKRWIDITLFTASPATTTAPLGPSHR